MNHKVPGDGGNIRWTLTQREGNHKLPTEERGADNAGVGRADIKFCTIACEYAEWPRDNVDGAKSCRTFSAIWCTALNQHTTRNAPCALEHGARRPKPNW
jgi:hypothetical protein